MYLSHSPFIQIQQKEKIFSDYFTYTVCQWLIFMYDDTQEEEQNLCDDDDVIKHFCV